MTKPGAPCPVTGRTGRTGVDPQPRRTAAAATALVLLLMIMVCAVPGRSSAADVPAGPMRTGVAFGDELVWQSSAELAASLDSAKALGVDWIRVDLSWADIQWDGPKVYHWDRFDRVMNAANERDLRVIAVLAYTPPWARKAGCTNQSCSPRDVLEFVKFGRLAAERYSVQGLHHWEVWNEPNIPLFWYPQPDPAAYTRVLKATTEMLRSVDPKATVLMGGLSASQGEGAAIAQVEFLADVTRLGGTQVVDAVAFHPYTFPLLPSWTPKDPRGWRTSWNTIHGNLSMPAGQFYSLRQVLNEYKMWGKPIWITEYGAPTGGPGTYSDGTPGTMTPTMTHTTEDRQAQLATSAVQMAVDDPTIGALVWYSEKDRSFDPADTENFFGLRRADGTKKPAWYALRDAIRAQRSLRPAA